MAITGSEHTVGGTTSPSSPETTASISPTGNYLQLAAVHSSRGGGSAPGSHSISGGGMTTWTQIVDVTFTDSATETHRASLHRSLEASPGSGTASVTHGNPAANNGVDWCFVEYSEVDTGGTNGADAIVQNATNTGSGTTASATLAAFGDTTNNAVHIAAASFSATHTPEAGYTGYTERNYFQRSRDAWDLGEDTSPSMTMGTSVDWAAIAVEIKAAAGGGGGGIGIAVRAHMLRTMAA